MRRCGDGGPSASLPPHPQLWWERLLACALTREGQGRGQCAHSREALLGGAAAGTRTLGFTQT